MICPACAGDGGSGWLAGAAGEETVTTSELEVIRNSSQVAEGTGKACFEPSGILEAELTAC